MANEEQQQPEKSETVDPTVAKCAELKLKHNTNVFAIVIKGGENVEDAVAYIKEPTLTTELMVLDRGMMGSMWATCSDVLDTHLIKEESDPRICESNKPYWKGAIRMIMQMIETSHGEFKKK